MIKKIGWRKRQHQKNVPMKRLAPFLEEINVLWIKCILQASKETYIAVKYGFMFYLCADLQAVTTTPCPRHQGTAGGAILVPPGMAVGVQTLVPVGERKALLWGGRVAGVEKKNKNPQKIHF